MRIGGWVSQKQLLPRRQLPRSPFQYKHGPDRTGRCTLGSSTFWGRFPSQPLWLRPDFFPDFFPMMYGAALGVGRSSVDAWRFDRSVTRVALQIRNLS